MFIQIAGINKPINLRDFWIIYSQRLSKFDDLSFISINMFRDINNQLNSAYSFAFYFCSCFSLTLFTCSFIFFIMSSNSYSLLLGAMFLSFYSGSMYLCLSVSVQFFAFLMMFLTSQTQKKPLSASYKASLLQNCSLMGLQQWTGYSSWICQPFAVRYLRVTLPLKEVLSLFLRLSLTRIRPPQVLTSPSIPISSSEGKDVLLLVTTKESVLSWLYSATLSESTVPQTSSELVFQFCSPISMSKVSGKKVKLKFSNRYFLRSSTSVAQKQLKPLTSLRHSQTLDLNESEIPMIVVQMFEFSTCSMNCLAVATELSPTSVSITNRFSAELGFTQSFLCRNSIKDQLA